MKKAMYIAASLAFLLFSLPVAAQIIIIEDGCDPYNPCTPPPARRHVVRRTPTRYSAPVAQAPVTLGTIPSAPKGLDAAPYQSHFSRWGLGIAWSSGWDEEGPMEGGGVYLQYMFSRHWGIEGGLEWLFSAAEDYMEYRDIFRASASALWFPGGLKMDGVSWYLKAGIVSTSVVRYGETYVRYDGGYGGYEYYEDEVSGSSLQFGGGLHWRMLDGFLSFGLEALIIGAPEKDEDEAAVDNSQGSAAFNLRFTTAIHF